MSRIAGVLRARDGRPAVAALDAMLAATGGGARSEPPLGATGRASQHGDADRAVVLDGKVLNRVALGAREGEDDAALVARLVAERGFEAALERINGDFAVAHLDRRTGELWLGRDRLGLRPLFYLPDAEHFAFASRPRALLALPGVDAAPDRSFLARFAGSHYRTFDNELEGSPYVALSQVPAGHALRVADGRITVQPWWSLADVEPLEGSEAELAERYRELLLDAVALRVAGAGRPAFTLSGGMDSSSVLASAVRALHGRQHAFSAVYGAHEFDESVEIRSMLDLAVEQWHQIDVTDPDVLTLVDEMVRVHDEPVATATWLSHWVLCNQAARDGFEAIFGGLGGDELNAGEYEYFTMHFADLRAKGRERELAHEIDEWARHHDHPIFRKDARAAEQNLARLTDPDVPGRCLPDRGRIMRYAGALAPDFRVELETFAPVMDQPFRSYLLNRCYQDLFRETTPCCLRAEDRHTAALGLRNVDPFLDHRLVEFMFAVPGELKIRDGVTKRLLREATVGLLPEETRTRIKKTGWNAPADRWFSGDGRGRVLELVESHEFRDRGIYDVAEVRRLLDEHDEIVSSGRPAENHMMFFWQLVNLELWLRGVDELP
jgi:asparagine synthase (glutamine-hydrolysing)